MIKTDPNTLVDPKFVGIPYVHQGRSLEGADCIGVAILWLREQGLDYEYDDGKGEVMKNWWERHPRRFLDAMLQIGKIVKFSEVRKYDCLMFVLGNEGNTFPSCLGVMVDDRHFLVSVDGRGSFVQILDMFWKQKYFGAIRLHAAAGKAG